MTAKSNGTKKQLLHAISIFRKLHPWLKSGPGTQSTLYLNYPRAKWVELNRLDTRQQLASLTPFFQDIIYILRLLHFHFFYTQTTSQSTAYQTHRVHSSDMYPWMLFAGEITQLN